MRLDGEGAAEHPGESDNTTGPMLHAVELWQWPLMLGTSWWNVMVQACWPDEPTMRHVQACGDRHQQLVVPQPIKDDGERSLVA